MALRDPNDDRRIKRTQRLLTQALIDLIREKGYEAVTIRDITNRADVAYATFFRNYPDKEAVLSDVLSVVLGELAELDLPTVRTTDPAQAGELLFDYVAKRTELWRVLVSARGSTMLLQRMIAAGTQRVLDVERPRHADTVPPDLAAYHLATSTVALIHWWLVHEMPYAPDRMGLIYRDLLYQATYTVVPRE